MTAKPVKLTPAQYQFLIDVYASGGKGVYAVDDYKPATKLVELGLIEPLPFRTVYVATEAGVEWVENSP
jgi:hypothetical protein